MSEARLDFTGSTQVLQRELDKAVRDLAKVREQNRRLNEEAKKGYDDSSKAVGDFASKLSTAARNTNTWADGMKRMQVQLGATRADFSVLASAMRKTAEVKDPFAGWVKGLENLKAASDRWRQGMGAMASQQNPYSAFGGLKPSAGSSGGWGHVGRWDSFQAGLANLEKQRSDAKEKTKTFLDMEAIGEVSGAVAGLAARIFGVGAAAAGVVGIYSQWRQKTDELVQSHDELSLTFTKALAESGKLQLAPQAEQFIKGLRGVSPKAATATLGGVLSSGETLSDKRAFAITEQVAKLAPTGMDMFGAGGLSADIADIVGEGVSPEDIADLTVGVKQQLREKTHEFQGRKFQKQISALKASGMSGREALASAVVALQSEYGSEALKTLADKTGRTPDQRKMLRTVFTPEAVAGVSGQLESAMSGNAAAQQLDALRATGLTRAAIQQEAKSEVEGKAALAADPYAEASRGRAMRRTRAWEQGVWDYAVEGAFQGFQRMGDAFRVPDVRSEMMASPAGGQVLLRAFERNTQALERNTASQARLNVDAHTE